TPPSDDLILLKNTDRKTIAIDCRNCDLTEVMHELYASHKLTSVLVEAGPKLLDSFIKAGLWDEIRIEVSPLRLGEDGIHHAPEMPGPPDRIETICRQNIYYKSRI
ncbi:MAG: dihydrofolate reductase family protein, partial [Muribaculaceae bacterium]|nr:dihydrofolate reductase family protein [Muribaculaceae bacterium]